jgi:hypothetical protein
MGINPGPELRRQSGELDSQINPKIIGHPGVVFSGPLNYGYIGAVLAE